MTTSLRVGFVLAQEQFPAPRLVESRVIEFYGREVLPALRGQSARRAA